jgi:hypothetical protein
MAYMGDRKRGTISDGNASRSGDGAGGMKSTGVGSHMSRGARVHVPVATASVGGRSRSGVQRGEEGRIPRRRRHRGQRW